MTKSQKPVDPSEVPLPEKYPLTKLPEQTVKPAIPEEEIDKIPDEEEQEETGPYEPPVPAEGP